MNSKIADFTTMSEVSDLETDLKSISPQLNEIHVVIEGKGVIKNDTQVLKCVRMLNGLSI